MKTTVGIHQAAEGLVVSDPEILGGKPVFCGTRLPLETLFNYLADGQTLDYYLETFPLVTREQAVAVLRYGQQRIHQGYIDKDNLNLERGAEVYLFRR